MQMVLAIVQREPVLAAVQREPALRDPIAVTADDRAEVGRVVLQIALRAVETEHDIRQLAIAIRRFEGNKYAAVVRDPCLNSMGVRQRVKIDHLLIGRLSERLSLNARFGFRRPPWIPQWNEAKAQRQSQKKSVSIAHHRRLSRCCLCACHPSSRCIFVRSRILRPHRIHCQFGGVRFLVAAMPHHATESIVFATETRSKLRLSSQMTNDK